jgi:hypothetical protein
VCQRLARAVNALAVDTPQGQVKITISAGIAALGDHPDAALAAADSALYRAKAEGRARLRVAACRRRARQDSQVHFLREPCGPFAIGQGVLPCRACGPKASADIPFRSSAKVCRL